MLRKTRAIIPILILSLVVIPRFIPMSHAEISSCTADVQIQTAVVDETETYNFSVSNTSSDTAIWVRVTRPSDNFTINSADGPWGSDVSESTVTYPNASLEGGGYASLEVSATAGSSNASSANWVVQMSDNSGGSGATTCTGELGTQIVGEAISEAPQISDVVISDITSSQAKISWTTNENADSLIDYGLTEEYGLSESDSTQTTSHAVTLSGLTASTKYYFIISSTDENSNSGQSEGLDFTSAAPNSTAQTITITTTTTTTNTVTKTITKAAEVIVDRTKPSITITTDLSKVFDVAPQILGQATDPGGIEELEYSLDAGANYLPVDTFTRNSTSTKFTFLPLITDDGDYKIIIRATDDAGNIGYTRPVTLIIDRLPPLIGGSIFSLGPQILESGSNGEIVTLSGIKQIISLAAKGGPIHMTLFASLTARDDARIASEAAETVILTKNIDTGLWSGSITFDSPGSYRLSVQAVDGAGNTNGRILRPVIVLPRGEIKGKLSDESLVGAQTTVYYQEPLAKEWVVWDSSSYGQKNPQKSEKDGTYAYFLPPGTYYLSFQANGFKKAISKIFTLKMPAPIATDVKLSENLGIQIGNFRIPFIDFLPNEVTVRPYEQKVKEKSEVSLLRKEAPLFALPTTENRIFDLLSIRGKPFDLILLSTWSPAAVEQIALLDGLTPTEQAQNSQYGVVALQENSPALQIFLKRGNYKSQFIVDPDGTLVNEYNLHGLPTHYFLDTRGIIRSTHVGVLNADEIREGLAETREGN